MASLAPPRARKSATRVAFHLAPRLQNVAAMAPSMSRARTTTLPEARPQPASIGSLFGAYGVVAPIGRGATAEVYLGQHHATGERVAIKALDPRYCQHGDIAGRLLGERGIADRCNHPGLLEIFDSGYSLEGVPYLVMELLDGESLQALIDRQDVSLEAMIMIGSQIASAVAGAHAAGVIHCDIKPANVYVLYEATAAGWPRIKVIDFGVARLTSDPPLPNGEIAGTPSFMAPEQWHGEASDKSDVYALGCLMYELVTGEPMFSGTLPKLMLQHCEQLPERPSTHRADIPAELERLIVRSLAKDPAMRPTMAELANELAWMVSSAQQDDALDAVG